jgi:hypothetical protein
VRGDVPPTPELVGAVAHAARVRLAASSPIPGTARRDLVVVFLLDMMVPF